MRCSAAGRQRIPGAEVLAGMSLAGTLAAAEEGTGNNLGAAGRPWSCQAKKIESLAQYQGIYITMATGLRRESFKTI